MEDMPVVIAPFAQQHADRNLFDDGNEGERTNDLITIQFIN